MSVGYVCVSATCRREIEIELSHGVLDENSKVCSCGAEMKKVYTAPAFRKLSEAEAQRFFADCIKAGTLKRATSG